MTVRYVSRPGADRPEGFFAVPSNGGLHIDVTYNRYERRTNSLLVKVRAILTYYKGDWVQAAPHIERNLSEWLWIEEREHARKVLSRLDKLRAAD